ncbi:uroporphyrinogen-III synthase [Bradyrhizobium sp. NP1]|uniref:uroporphyrinogen-III synthase n=1 Tax=Bradyrhizobium sp. NP1 TaxID=3049772 RepID=UPI0025A5A069|nr:uroporphyrinogen-III synthase [Bradyrhizobium sp. NP1]WJR78495.1 uroporphyrinogen-III synthase [Bradyrhizobium sp. NP1]
MAILITRPQPDADATAARLRARGLQVLLAPVLRFEALALPQEAEEDCDAVIVTSANALRAIKPQLVDSRLTRRPLFAVGGHTAEAAREAGFTKVFSAEGDAVRLRDLLLARVQAKALKKSSVLLYLAGADLSRDLAGELGERGFTVVTQTTYRMVPVAKLPRETCEAFVANAIEAVLHYSRRGARAFLDAARAEGVEISALAIPHGCISEAVAAVLREAGATQVMVAAAPDENALFETLRRALRSGLA